MKENKEFRDELKRKIDHTCLSMNSDLRTIATYCQEAASLGYGAVCLREKWVDFARSQLPDDFPIAAVAKFPETKSKTVDEFIDSIDYKFGDVLNSITNSLKQGANEIDLVMNMGVFKAGHYNVVEKEISSIKTLITKKNILKVIIETGFLDEKEILRASRICENAGADYVKTSTGYGIRGASVRDMEIMSDVLKEKTGIKASGQIKSLDQAITLYTASQSVRPHPFRIGASSLYFI